MRKYLKRSLALLLSAVMLICAVPVQGFAAEDSGSEFTGTYSYTSNEGSNKQETDRFIWRDDFFKTHASYNNPRLCTLSTQVALASASRYGDAGLYPISAR